MLTTHRTIIRWAALAAFAIAGLCLGNQFPTLNWGPVTGTVQASSHTTNAGVQQPNAPLVCPAAVISGTIGSGSPSHPFVTGNQTSRLFRDSVESSCGAQKATPNLTDAGIQFKFDAFTFANTSHSSICITVITTAGANNQIFTAAYRGSFDPANVQTNYAGDAGNSDKIRSFSFTVAAAQSFVVVQSRVNNAANPPSLGYSFRVLGLPGCDACPPDIIQGTIGTGSAQYPATSDTQSGRLFRNNQVPACNAAKTVPSVEDPTTQFSYDAYTFLNPSASSVCVTVNTTAGANNQILTAAYLDRYNPFDIQENYLGDAGNSNQQRSFSFTVPAKRSFVVVQSRVNTAGNPTSLSYFFSVTGLMGCTACAAITVNPTDVPDGILGSAYPSTTITQTGGTGPITWSLVGGALPNNMTLNTSTGALSGTPTISGNFSFSIRATDSNGCLGEKVYFMTIFVCSTITISPASLPNGNIGIAYNQQLSASGGTSSTYTYSLFSSPLPAGVTLSSTGLLSGTPSAVGQNVFTVKATDANGCTGTKTYVLSVNCATTVSPLSRNVSATGGAFSVSVTAGGTCAWQATSNAAWLTLSGNTIGQGNGTVNYTVAANTGASRTGTITVNNAVHTVFQATADVTQDTDGDGIPDSVEITEGRNPLVKDNDIFANNRLFVMQQYRDFLGREGDTGGINNWVSALNNNTLTRPQVIESFFNSTEFQNTGAPIVRLYFAYFLRIPDYAGLQNWINAFRGGMSLDTISNAFAGSAEFIQTYGNLNNTQFVTLVYNNVLGRAPDQAGLANWVNALNNGMTRGTMMLNFSESAEYRPLIANNVYVTMMYVGMLRRAPDQAGFDNWVAYLNQGNSGLNLINQFIVAQEYHNRFLP